MGGRAPDILIDSDWPPPRSGNPNNGGASPTDWDRLSRGQTIGKSAVVHFVKGAGVNDVTTRPFNVFELRGNDSNALPLNIQIGPPMMLPSGANSTVRPGQEQQISGTVTTKELLRQPDLVTLANPGLLLTWGIGGVQFQVIVDILQGSNINVSASWVRADVLIEDVDFTANTYYQLAAFVGPGRPNGNAQRTIHVGIMSSGATSDAYAVPPFAKTVSAIGSNGADVYVGSVRFFRDVACTAPVAEYLFSGNPGNASPQAVPNGAYFFKLISGTSLADNNVVFGLTV